MSELFYITPEYKDAQNKSGGNPTEYDITPELWHQIEGNLPIPFGNEISPKVFTPRILPLDWLPVAYRMLNQEDMTFSFNQKKEKTVYGRLQIVFRNDTPPTFTHRPFRFGKVVLPIPVDMIISEQSRSAFSFDTIMTPKVYDIHPKDSDSVGKSPTFYGRIPLDEVVPDLVALSVRRFYGFKDLPRTVENPDNLLSEMRQTIERIPDITRLMLDLDFQKGEGAKKRFRRGGNYGGYAGGSSNISIDGLGSRELWGEIGEIIGWVAADAIIRRIFHRDD